MSEKHAEQSRQLTARVATITGSWWCASGSHYARGEPVARKGARICAACHTRITALRQSKARR